MDQYINPQVWISRSLSLESFLSEKHGAAGPVTRCREFGGLWG